MKIRHIAGVGALRRHEAMLLATWVEVSDGGIERRVTFSDRVHMKGMFACRQPLHRYLEQKCRQESAPRRESAGYKHADARQTGLDGPSSPGARETTYELRGHTKPDTTGPLP